jgi:O-antigen/teichoic acid export membrane protein
MTPPNVSLKSSAKQSIFWGGGFTLLRDILQFAAMLVMVRLLTPEIYGSAALAQSIIGLLSVLSFNTFYLHAFQIRDPNAVDWQAHFTAAFFINISLVCVTLLIAFGLTFSRNYQSAAGPLAAMSVVFVIEIAATVRHGMLETRHEWKRFRLLLSLGTALGLGSGLLIAWSGGGVWALVVQSPLFGLPAAIDLFIGAKWRPDWTWTWARYRATVIFGANRMVSLALQRGRLTIEQSVLTGVYNFATLGIFTRAIGLANLLAGRIGTLAVGTLYPVITRAEPHSVQLQRMAGLLVCCVCWTSIPAAVLLGLCAEDVVALLYGPKWLPVAALLPLATASVALAGFAAALSKLLLANNMTKTCLVLDASGAMLAVVLAFWLVPIGVMTYLRALVATGGLICIITMVVAVKSKVLTMRSLNDALIPSGIAVTIAVIAVTLFRTQFFVEIDNILYRISLDTLIFNITYLIFLRLSAPKVLQKLLELASVKPYLKRIFFK